MQTALEMTCTSQNQREVIFLFAPPPTPRRAPLQTVPQPQAQKAGLVPRVARWGKVTDQIEPCIKDMVSTHVFSIGEYYTILSPPPPTGKFAEGGSSS